MTKAPVSASPQSMATDRPAAGTRGGQKSSKQHSTKQGGETQEGGLAVFSPSARQRVWEMGICRRGAPSFVAAVLVIFLAVPFVSDHVFAMGDPSDDLVEVDFGERGYLIPRHYVSLFHKDPRGRNSVLEMRLLWPTLEPRGPQTAHLWQRRDTLRHLRVTLFQRGNSGYYKLNNLLSRAEFTGPVTKPALELEFRSRSGFRIFHALDGGYTTPAGEPYTFFCNDVPEKTYEVFEVELLCIAEYQLGSGAWIRVHFFEDNIANWKDIDIAVRHLIDSFER